jgi:hypothetical protein
MIYPACKVSGDWGITPTPRRIGRQNRTYIDKDYHFQLDSSMAEW